MLIHSDYAQSGALLYSTLAPQLFIGTLNGAGSAHIFHTILQLNHLTYYSFCKQVTCGVILIPDILHELFFTCTKIYILHKLMNQVQR